jgi:trehalose 6-phosphate synthase
MENTFKKKVIIVSNREPYTFRKGRLSKTVGGLVSALDPLMRSNNGVWISTGSASDIEKSGARVSVPPGDGAYSMRRVAISPGDVENYYNGYSNRFLWPLCHMTLDRVHHLRSYWRSYVKVNGLLAEAVLEEGARDSIIWLQDYHLALCAAEIRSRDPGALISLFWHIPWPPHAVFRICPQRKELLRGLLANDLLGFQLESFKVNFMRCVEKELGALVDMEGGAVHLDGRTTYLKSFPISVDFASFESAAASAEAAAFLKRFLRARNLDGVFVALSVNRLDYTKGMIKCLEMIEVFFSKYARYRGRVSFVQVAVPTRKVEPFLSYRDRVRRKVESINSKFSTDSWKPVEYLETDLTHTELAALYRHAGLAIISSVYDGMNLVAKEYISSQCDLAGSLLISEFAGAAEEIPGVTMINPYDTESCADELRAAIEKEPGRKRAAMEEARAYVKKHDVYRWVRKIFREMDQIKDGRLSFETPGKSKLTVE